MFCVTKMSFQLFEHICQNKILINLLKDVNEIKMKDGAVIYMKDNLPYYRKGYNKKEKHSLTENLIMENSKEIEEDHMDKALSMYDDYSTRGDNMYENRSWSDDDDNDENINEGVRIPINMSRETPEDYLPPTPKTPVMKGTKCDIDLPSMTIPPSKMSLTNAPMLRSRRMTDADDRKELERRLRTLSPRVYNSIARAVNFYSNTSK